MVQQVNPPRGMRDFVPADKRQRDRVIGTIAQTYRHHGFESIETPVMEDHATLHSGLGGDNEKLSFQILRRGLSVEQLGELDSLDQATDLGLRFDLTVPLARFVASHHQELPSVFRALHIGPVWRAERPQKGRFRQFVQCDIDIVGEAGPLAEREVLLATADALQALGVSTYRFRLNDRRLLFSVLARAGVAEDNQLSVLVTLDKLDKIGRQGVLDELQDKHPGGVDLGVIDEVLSAVEAGDIALDADVISGLMGDSQVAAELVSWAQDVKSLLGDDRIVFDPTLVRGMGYYTGSIVELEHPELGVSLGGGGRYDGMVGRFLGKDMPAFGFSLGFERLMEVLEPDHSADSDRVAVVYAADTPVAELLALKTALIAEGKSVRLVQETRNLKALFDRLDGDGIRLVAQVGESVPAVAGLSWRELGGR
jgi:histidyl-tRNA synthetase